MNCSNCGSPIKEGIKFCGKCGASVVPPVKKIIYEDPQEPIPVAKEKPKKKKKLFLIPIISALLTIAILLPTVILPYFSGKGDVKPFISSLSAGDGHSVAIKADGTVYATGKYKDEMKNWTEIVALASSGDFTAGLRADGSVVLAGSSFDLPANEWNGITQIAVGDNHIVGLKKDGTVIASDDTSGEKCDEVRKWDGIVLVASNNSHTFGVKNDGTVVATGKPQGSGDVTGWKDIVSVSSNDEVTVGLKKNGTVVITDYDGDTDYDVSKWKNIVQVSAGENHIVALKKDGTVVATGDTSNNKTDVSDWENIKDVSAGGEHTIALKEDGTVIATGDNSQGQCEVEAWTDVHIPVIEKEEEPKEETQSKIKVKIKTTVSTLADPNDVTQATTPPSGTQANTPPSGTQANTPPSGTQATPPVAKKTTVEILAIYNTATKKAEAAKVPFSKDRNTTEKQYEAGMVLNGFKDIVYKFMGVGNSNKFTKDVTKEDADSYFKYFKASSLSEADVSKVAIKESGGNYEIRIAVKNGSSSVKGGKVVFSGNSPLDRSGISCGNKDNDYWDHKTAENIYTAVSEIPGCRNANIYEKYSDAMIVAVVNVSTGNLVSLSAKFNFHIDLSDVMGSSGVTEATSVINMKNFRW